MYPRNSASPLRIAVGPVIQISDGAVQTSGVSVAVRPEGGAESAGGGTIAYGASSGIVYYTPTQAETNYEAFAVIAYKTGCIPVSQNVITTASATAGYAGTDQSKIANPTATVALTGTTIATTQKVDVETIKTNPVVNGGTITFPTNATLASTTNITAGTITTVTNQLTAAQIATGVWQDATAGDFTVANSIGKALYIANIAPGAAGGHFIAGSNAGTLTVGAMTITGALTLGSLSNGGALTQTGNVSFGGTLSAAGRVTLSEGLSILCTDGSKNALLVEHNAASGAYAAARIAANNPSAAGLDIYSASGTPLSVLTFGSEPAASFFSLTGNGIHIGGVNGVNISASGNGIDIGAVGNGIDISSDGVGIAVATTAAHGITVAAAGASKHGVLITGGSSGTSDGVNLVAGSGGVALRAGSTTITGALSLGSLANAGTTSLSGAVSMGSTLAVTGAASVGSFTNAGTTSLAGAVALGSTLAVTGAVSVGSFANAGTTSLAGAVTLGSTLAVTGAVTLTSRLNLQDGLKVSASTTDRIGVEIAGNGAGAGMSIAAGATGTGLAIAGGSSSGDAVALSMTSGHIGIARGIRRGVALPNYTFRMFDTSGNPATGLTVTATRRLDSGAFGACANAVSEVSSGFYSIDFATTDTDGGVAVYLFTAPGARDTSFTFVTEP